MRNPPSSFLFLLLPVSDPKLCAIPVTPNGHLDPSLPSTPPVAAGGVTNSSRNSLQPDQIRVAVGSRKSSVMSLGRMTCDQRSLVSESVSRHVCCPLLLKSKHSVVYLPPSGDCCGGLNCCCRLLRRAHCLSLGSQVSSHYLSKFPDYSRLFPG